MLLAILAHHQDLLGYLGANLEYLEKHLPDTDYFRINVMENWFVSFKIYNQQASIQYNTHLFSTDSVPSTGTQQWTRGTWSLSSWDSQTSGKMPKWMFWNDRLYMCYPFNPTNDQMRKAFSWSIYQMVKLRIQNVNVTEVHLHCSHPH